SEEHTSEIQSLTNFGCRLLLEKNKKTTTAQQTQPPHSCTVYSRSHRETATSHIPNGRHATPVKRDGCGLTLVIFFFFNDTATTEIYTLSLHDALPILSGGARPSRVPHGRSVRR